MIAFHLQTRTWCVLIAHVSKLGFQVLIWLRGFCVQPYLHGPRESVVNFAPRSPSCPLDVQRSWVPAGRCRDPSRREPRRLQVPAPHLHPSSGCLWVAVREEELGVWCSAETRILSAGVPIALLVVHPCPETHSLQGAHEMTETVPPGQGRGGLGACYQQRLLRRVGWMDTHSAGHLDNERTPFALSSQNGGEVEKR